MHFSIPDTRELTDINRSPYRGYNIHINGVFHCTVRYKQLHNLHEQLKKEFGSDRLPSFPPKKLLPLTEAQLEERRASLEKYIQAVGQDPRIASSELLVGFLLSAQQESTCEKRHEVNLDIYTMNNYHIPLLVLTTDRTEQVLTKVFRHLSLSVEYMPYFSLFLIKKDNNGDITIIKKLQGFESPYISFKTVRDANRIVLRKRRFGGDYFFHSGETEGFVSVPKMATVVNRFCTRVFNGLLDFAARIAHHLEEGKKPFSVIPITHFSIFYRFAGFAYRLLNYWDKNYDLELMSDPVALNLLYIQALSDIERGWTFCTRETKNTLANLQAQLAKKEYIELARLQKHYGFIQFTPSYCDYPRVDTKVLISIGDQELNMRILGTGQLVKEGSFKVTRMRCWRITAIQNKERPASNSNCDDKEILELSFEYLMSKDKLQWITVTSDQAILMSVCLQSVVDELLLKRSGSKRRVLSKNKRNWSYMKRDGSSQLISLDEPDCQPDSNNEESQNTNCTESFSIKTLQEKFSSVSFKSGKEFVENDAFEGIGDDDL